MPTAPTTCAPTPRTGCWESDEWEDAARRRLAAWERGAAARRLNEWKERMTSGIHARIKWATQEPNDVIGEMGLDPRPQAAAARFYEELRAHWAPDDLPTAHADHLPGVVEWAARHRFDAATPTLTASALAAALRRNRGKAASVDGLHADELSRMPPTFLAGSSLCGRPTLRLVGCRRPGYQFGLWASQRKAQPP